MCLCDCTENFQYPEVFSLGLVSHEDPSEEHLNNITFSMMFYGEGWTERGSTPEENNKPPNKTIITKVNFCNFRSPYCLV